MLRFFNKRLHNRKGFTLIELIVVIAILAILVLIAVPRLAGFRHNAGFRADIASARTLATAAQAWHSLDPVANVGDPTADAEFTALVPADLVTDGYATQLDSADAFDVDVATDGEVTVVAGAAGTFELFPDVPNALPAGNTYP